MENGKVITAKSEFLPCISQVAADVEIIPAISNFQPARVKSKTWLSEQILEIVLEVNRVFYNAKSVVTLKHPETAAVRSYSVVSLGKRAYDSLTFHVKLRAGGLFSTLFANLSVGDRLDYTMVNPLLPHYDTPVSRVNVVSGGSGMGAALSRALELATKYKPREIGVYAVNRAEICDYHLGCIAMFCRSVECEVNVTNIPFHDWTSVNFDIEAHLAQDALTVGVGSDLVISRLQNLPFCELESFG
ncbi:FAD-binding oxidoreductase [Pectobacteriaceae bacterium CE70]|nr:FAD-binding oxidoreductase [Pectobacteriaceae bacterium CE70]WJY09271.1 FAD-binding oxidoreductase [Pectobacteriaceae bacterium C80]